MRLESLSTFIAVIIAASGSGCMAMVASHDEVTTIGRPIDALKVSAIQPGNTTFSELLKLLGPPDYIVEDQQQVVDEESFFAAFRGSPKIQTRPISTRHIKAPPDTVILVYGHIVVKRKQTAISTPFLPVPMNFGRDEISQYVARENQARAHEVLVYMRKRDQRVISVSQVTP